MNSDSLEGENLLEEADEQEDTTPLSAEEIVDAVMLSGSLTDASDVSVVMRSIDTKEEELVTTYADHGCTCDLGPHKSPCCKLFSADHYLSHLCAFAEMTHNELDLFVMRQVMANCFQSPSVPGDSSSPAEQKEIHNVTRFFHQGHRVCQPTLHNMYTSWLHEGTKTATHVHTCQ